MKADRLKHGRPLETLAVVCNCECSRFLHCPMPEDNPCKMAYKAHLKEMKATNEKKAAKDNGNH